MEKYNEIAFLCCLGFEAQRGVPISFMDDRSLPDSSREQGRRPAAVLSGLRDAPVKAVKASDFYEELKHKGGKSYSSPNLCMLHQLESVIGDRDESRRYDEDGLGSRWLEAAEGCDVPADYLCRIERLTHLYPAVQNYAHAGEFLRLAWYYENYPEEYRYFIFRPEWP